MSKEPAITVSPDFIEALAEAVARHLGASGAESSPSPWLTTEEAAERLKCGRERVKKLRATGELRFYREGRRCLHHVSDVDALMRKA